jgi:hypothetical protein
MGRLGLVPEQAFAEDFKQLRRDVEAIKNAQRVGRDILKPKIIECLDGGGNPTAYDIVATAVADPYGDGWTVRAEFVARFYADHQTESWGVPLFKIMRGSPSTPAAPGEAYGFTYPYLDDIHSNPGRVSYYGWFGNNDYYDNTSLYLKVYFYATDTGTLVVAEESIP